MNIVYDDKGTEKRLEHIAANFSLPTLAEPLTGRGKFDWKGETVDFDITLTTVGDLREKRPAKLVLALDTPAIAARFSLGCARSRLRRRRSAMASSPAISPGRRTRSHSAMRALRSNMRAGKARRS